MGYRYKPYSFLATRVEARYPGWSNAVDESGVAVGFGVIIP